MTVTRIGLPFPSKAVLNISYITIRPSMGTLKNSASMEFGVRTVIQSR